MIKRPIVSISIAIVFAGLAFSGIWLFFSNNGAFVVLLHTLLGALFIMSAFFHFVNNWQALKRYTTSRFGKWVLLSVFATSILLLSDNAQVEKLSRVYATFKSKQPRAEQSEITQYYQMEPNPNVILEVRAGEHFWFPQIAVWIEDLQGNFIKTLLVTHSTAKGDFIGGRTKENFKEFDKKKSIGQFERRRVDALPYWSHARGVQATDGLFAPTIEEPLPDGITGATPDASFVLESKYPKLEKFKLLLEANVAFDDNKFYSSYDFPDDSLYHSGTGLLGQPSVVYELEVDMQNQQKYFMMEYVGHTYPSGISGDLFKDNEGLTTAKHIIDLALLKLDYPALE